MLYKTSQPKILVFLIFIVLLAVTFACSLLQSTAPASAFKPGDPTATPLGTDITDPNFIKGVEAYQAQKYDEVISFMSAVIDANPNLAPPHRYKGMAYWYLGDCAGALPDIEKALSINPNYAIAWADHGALMSCLGDEKQQFLDFQKALALDPSLSKVHHNMGATFYTNHEYKKALEEFNLSIAIDPHRGVSWSAKSETLQKLGRSEECIDSATKGLEINPKEYPIYSDRASCEVDQKNYSAAVLDYEIYTTNFESVTPQEWYNMGIAQYENVDPQNAIDSYSKALELEPSFYFAYANRGIAYNKIKEYEKALSDFNAALEGGDIPPAYSGRGEAYYRLGDFDQAISDLDLAISLNPQDMRASCFLAATFFDIEEYQDALDTVEAFSVPGYTCREQNILEIQARSYYGLGDYDQGILYMNETIAQSPYPLGYYYRGIIFQAAGKDKEAIQDLKLFLTLASSSDEDKEEISDAKARLVKLK